MEQNEVRVWDPFVRIFHWSLLLTFTVAWISGDELEVLHINAGYAVLGLVLLRIVWGFIGNHHARFRDFVYPPAEVKGFLRDTLKQRARRYLGHNPAGGAMHHCDAAEPGHHHGDWYRLLWHRGWRRAVGDAGGCTGRGQGNAGGSARVFRQFDGATGGCACHRCDRGKQA